MMKKIFYMKSPIGQIAIVEENSKISELIFEQNFSKIEAQKYEKKESKILTRTVQQLNEYFDKKRKIFTVPIALSGTDFQKRVWHTLETISYGKTASYKEIAIKINSPKAYRAVGMANNKNPIPIIIPCHRIIASNGNLTGYNGGLKIKEYLLELEKNSLFR